jgi:DNA-binding MarR family transcriptional regulator
VAKKAAGLEPADWSALCYLAGRTSASSDELRADLALQPGSLTNALGRLRSHGYVMTFSDADDKRVKAHKLTPAGEEVVNDLVASFQGVLDTSSDHDA